MDDHNFEELQRIWELKEKGAITEEEYATIKAGILRPARAGPDESTTPPPAGAPSRPAPNAQPQSAGYQKKIGFGCLGLVVLLSILGAIGSGSQTTESAVNASSENPAAATVSGLSGANKEAVEKAANYKAMLEREIASMRGNNSVEVGATKEDIMAEAVLIAARAKAYEDEAPPVMDKETKSLRSEYKRLAVKHQVAAFPKLRAAQAGVFDRLMWEQNIRVAATGAQNKTLRFTGGLFADNAAISTARDNMSETMSILRFDQDRYEWYRGSESTYFKRTSLPDAAFANFNGSTWDKVEEPTGNEPPGCVPELAKQVNLKCD